MPGVEDPYTVVIDPQDLQPEIQKNGPERREVTLDNIEEGNIAHNRPRLQGNILSSDPVEREHLQKWEEILKAGHNFDKGRIYHISTLCIYFSRNFF